MLRKCGWKGRPHRCGNKHDCTCMYPGILIHICRQHVCAHTGACARLYVEICTSAHTHGCTRTHHAHTFTFTKEGNPAGVDTHELETQCGTEQARPWGPARDRKGLTQSAESRTKVSILQDAEFQRPTMPHTWEPGEMLAVPISQARPSSRQHRQVARALTQESWGPGHSYSLPVRTESLPASESASFPSGGNFTICELARLRELALARSKPEGSDMLVVTAPSRCSS